MAERFVFDAAGVEALVPGDRERRVWDEALKGLGVRVRPSGTKSWIVNASTAGADGKVRSRRITLGKCGEMSLEEARAEARKLLGAGIEAAAVEGQPAAGMDGRGLRGRGEGIGDRGPEPDSGGHGAAGSPAADDGAGRKTGAAAGRAAVETGADRPAGDPAGGLAKTLDGIRGGVDRIEAWSARTDAQLELLSGAVAAGAMDRRRGRRRLAAAVLAIVLAAEVGLAGGAFVQSRYPVLPRDDPTLGWKDYFWEHYEKAFKDCFTRAKAEESGRIDCTIEVRAR